MSYKFYDLKVRGGYLTDFSNPARHYILGDTNGKYDFSDLTFNSASITVGNTSTTSIQLGGNSLTTLAVGNASTTAAITLNGKTLNTAGGLVTVQAGGKILTSLIDTTATGGSAAVAGKVVLTDATGKLAESLIPSVALSEFLGQYASWEAAATAHASDARNGDTISILDSGSESNYTMYICVNDQEEIFADRFVILKSASGAVTQAEFDEYKTTVSNTFNTKQDTLTTGYTHSIGFYKVATNDLGQVTNAVAVTRADLIGSNGSGGLITAATSTSNGYMTSAQAAKLDGIEAGANAYVLPDATYTSKGGVIVDSDGLSVTGGKVSLKKATSSTIGGVIVSTGLTVDASGKVTLNKATSSTIGGVIVGNGLNVDTNGSLTLTSATASQLGGVKIGPTLTSGTGGVIDYNLAAATSNTLGGVKIGAGISVTNDGTISVVPAKWTSSSIASANFTSSTNSMTYTISSGIYEVKCIDSATGSEFYPSDIIHDFASSTTKIIMPTGLTATEYSMTILYRLMTLA